MRKSISFYLLPVLLTVLCLSSCSETGQKTEYTHVIPANATEVAALDLKSIVDKAGLNTSDSRATLQKFLGLLLEGGSANLKQEAETLLKDPAESGIDWNAPLYVFEAPTLHNTAITLKIADLKKFEAMLRLLVQEQLCTAPVEAGGYRSVEIKDAGVLLAYNDGTLLGVYGGSTEQLWRNLISKSGILWKGTPRPYDLRHAFASRNIIRWINNGKDVMELLPYLSAYMGHSELTSTLYYIHLLPENLRKSKAVDWDLLSQVYGKGVPEDED